MLRATDVSRWFGEIVPVNAVSMVFAPGITALLGPNGAGKSTLLLMLAGHLAPSRGTVDLDGLPVRGSAAARRRMGLLMDVEATYETLTGRELVTAVAELQQLPDAGAAGLRALRQVDLEASADRRIGNYSKGMRQRVKLAAAMVHDPEVLLLDEPFNGMDPKQRHTMMGILQSRAAEGCTIVLSSHILDEVDHLASRIEVMVKGRHAASGDRQSLRRKLSTVPYRYAVRTGDDRRFASVLVGDGCVRSISFEPEAGLQVDVVDLVRFTHLVPEIAESLGVDLWSLAPTDDSLESVFRYLVDEPVRP